MQQILKKISYIFIICLFSASVFAESNAPYGNVGDAGSIFTTENLDIYHDSIQTDLNNMRGSLTTTNISNTSTFVPLEVKLGISLMKALSHINSILETSLFPFTIVFLIIMYAFWIALESYKVIKGAEEYKKTFFNIFKKGLIISGWIIILDMGAVKIFTSLINPILALTTSISDYILQTVATTNGTLLPDTCSAITTHVTEKLSNADGLLLDIESTANILCLPGRLSTFFYRGVATGFDWMGAGITGDGFKKFIFGFVFVCTFIPCIFKYAFMTLGVATDLFLTLLMLPFTAVAEAMPSSDDKTYVGKTFNAFLGLFNTKKLSAIITKFINTAIYFISLSIAISLSSILISAVVTENISTGNALSVIFTGLIVYTFASKTEDIVKKLGGEIENSFGQQLQEDTKKVWDNAKSIGKTVYKAWLKS